MSGEFQESSFDVTPLSQTIRKHEKSSESQLVKKRQRLCFVESENCDYCAFYDCGDCTECEENDRLAHGDYMSKVLLELRDSDQLCDASLCTEDGFEIKVHSWLMSAVSPVLYNVLRNPNLKVTLTETSVEALKTLVDFAYTGTVRLKENTVKDVLGMSVKYLVDDLTEMCNAFIQNHLTTDNCISYMYVAKMYNLENLDETTRNFTLRNFPEVYKTSKEFLELLNAEDFISLLDDDLLNVTREEELLTAILKWANYDMINRETAISSLFLKIRLGLCYNTTFNAGPERRVSIFHVPPQPVPNYYKSRVPRALIFSFGGWCSGAATCSMEIFDVRANQWILSPFMDITARAYHGTAILNGMIYVVGGYNGYECFRSVRCFDPAMGAWHERNSMLEARCYVAATSLNGILYAIGGFDGKDRKASCESFNPLTNQWTMIADMNEIRSDASSASQGGKIIVCGGYNGEIVLSSAEMYDPEFNQWISFKSMPDTRSGHKLFWYQHSLYLLGGFSGTNRLNTVFRYSQLQGVWIDDAPLINPRSNFAVAELEGKLYVIGGFNGHAIISDVECYDPDEHCWKPTQKLGMPRSALDACTIADLPNAKRYSANGPFGKQKNF